MAGNVTNVLVGLAVAGVIVVAAALALHYRRKFGRAGLALVLVLLVFLGDARIDRSFVKPVALTDYIIEDELVRTLERDPGLFRVLPATGRGNVDQNYLPVFGIQTANGFHDNRMASYDRLIGAENRASNRLLALLNVKYVVTPRPIAESESYHAVMSSPLGSLTEIRDTLPRAFLVHHVRVMEDSAAVGELIKGSWPLRSQLLMPADPGVPLSDPPVGSPPETVVVESYDLGEIRLRVRAAAPALLFLGDNYYPAWHARVDGRETPVLRADVTFRAVPVPAGEHEILFRYHSPVLARSMTVSLVASFLVLALIGGEPILRRRRGRGPSGGAA
jgi:hypothetical protein